MNRKRLFVPMVLMLFLLKGCHKPEYKYNNLIETSSMDEFLNIATNHNVPKEDIAAITSYLQNYSEGDFATTSLSHGWQTSSVNKSLYNYTTAINAYTSNEFEDINCRQAAYLLYHSFFSAEGIVNQTQIINELTALDLNTEADCLKYEVLFGTITSDEAIADAVLARFQSVNANFSDTVQLVSLWGNDGNQIMHLHCGLLFEHSDFLYFFEKNDPMLPFQISLFPSTDLLKEYLLNRTDRFDNLVVFIDDTVL